MSAKAVLLIGIFVLLCIPALTKAVVPDTVSIQATSDWTGYSDWVLAGGSYVSTIVVTVTNTSGRTGNIWIHAIPNDPLLGVIQNENQSITLDSGNGSAVFKFVPSKKSGDAVIYVYLTDPDTGLQYHEPIWKKSVFIDHNAPRYVKAITFPANQTVGTNATISVQLSDIYGNIVNGRRNQNEYGEYVTFFDSEEGDSTFWDHVTYHANVHSYQADLDTAGDSIVWYQLPTRSGDNIIRIITPGSNQTKPDVVWITLRGTPSTPVNLASVVISNSSGGHQALADGDDRFFIYYSATDVYHNPVPGVEINWTTDRGEKKGLITNYQGLAFLEYGPSTEIHNVTLTGTNCTTNTITDLLSFVSDGASIFNLYTNPSDIASREANRNSVAYLRAGLTDSLGRPVAGERINFSIIREVASPSGTLASPSSFAESGLPFREVSAETNADGFAIVPFYPGAFPDENSSEFVPEAEGTATVAAIWHDPGKGDVERSVEIYYKNYPYLRVEANVSPSTVSIGNSTMVRITLHGDGYSPHRPVDVVLCDSRGESMIGDLSAFSGGKGVSNDKEVWAQKAVWNFTYEFSAQDRVGLVTFGNQGPTDLSNMKGKAGLTPGADNTENDDLSYIAEHYLPYPKNYSDYATIDIGLTRVDDTLRSAILALNVTPSKDSGGTNIVPVRYGLFKALQEVNNGGVTYPESTVRAVILLVDSEWSSWGNPLAGGTAEWSNPSSCVKYSQGYSGQYCAFPEIGDLYDPKQNLAAYAVSKDTRIFVIVLPKKGGSINSKVMNAYTTLATSTGGDIYVANSADDLSRWYYEIGQKLKIYANIDTKMNLSLQNVNISYQGTARSEPGSRVFAYEYEPQVSTFVASWNQSGMITDMLHVPPYPSAAIPGPVNGNITYPYSLDQTDDWSNDELKFYVGNVTIGQTWQAEFRLKALEPGLISLFGPGAEGICYVSEEGQKKCIPVPIVMVTAIQNVTDPTRDQNALDILDGSIDAKPVPSTDLMNVQWVLNYTGDSEVIQYAYYQHSSDNITWNGNWIRFGTNLTGGQNLDHVPYNLMIDVRNLIEKKPGFIRFLIKSYEKVPAGASDEEESDCFPLGNDLAKIKIT